MKRMLRELTDAHQKLLPTLRALAPGQRVTYHGWRGDHGTGTLLRFVNQDRKTVKASEWGHTRSDGMVVKRDFSSDDGVLFLPFAGDGDAVEALPDKAP